MSFEQIAARIPTEIGDIRVLLEVKADGSESVEYTVQALDARGVTMQHRQGDLAPHLSAAQISSLRALMVDVRKKAQALIPVPE